jgi:CheY-like chemotaxis protein
MFRVLVVDDDSSVRRVMAQMLGALGYDVVTARNGLDALDLFCWEGETIHLVITDLRMPVMNGYEAVEGIRKLDPAIPIVCTSSDGSALRPPGTVFLPKPFTLVAIQDCVTRALTCVRTAPVCPRIPETRPTPLRPLR